MKNTIDWEVEDEDGISPLGVPSYFKFEVTYSITAGEPMVMYFKDGSGYPGSPDEIEFYGVRCLEIDNKVPTKEEDKQFSAWYLNLLNECGAEHDRLRDYIWDIPECEPDWDDWND